MTFGGVRIGAVADILLRVNARTLAARIPVYVKIGRSRITYFGGPERADSGLGRLALNAASRRSLGQLVEGAATEWSRSVQTGIQAY